MKNKELSKYDSKYSPIKLWQKISKYAKTAGYEVIEKVLWLYYALEEPDLPNWSRRTIISALAYFIFPLDAIPDIAPMIGYVDDLGVLSAAVATLALYINDDVKLKANEKLKKWFN